MKDDSKEVLRKLVNFRCIGPNFLKEAIKKNVNDIAKSWICVLQEEEMFINEGELLRYALEVNNIKMCLEILKMVNLEEKKRFFCDYISTIDNKSYHTAVTVIEKMKEYDISLKELFEAGLAVNNKKLIDGCLHLDRELIKLATENYSTEIEEVLTRWRTLIYLSN